MRAPCGHKYCPPEKCGYTGSGVTKLLELLLGKEEPVPDNVVQFPKSPGQQAHEAAMEHLSLMYDLLAQENDTHVEWEDTPALAPFCGCQDCVVREVLFAGIMSLRETGVLVFRE